MIEGPIFLAPEPQRGAHPTPPDKPEPGDAPPGRPPAPSARTTSRRAIERGLVADQKPPWRASWGYARGSPAFDLLMLAADPPGAGAGPRAVDGAEL